MRQKAQKLTREFIDHAKDGNWPDTVATGLIAQVTNGGRGKSFAYEFTSPTEFTKSPGGMTKNKLARWQAEHPNKPLPPDEIRYKRRTMGLGSVRAVKGGLSLVEAREKAIQLTKLIRGEPGEVGIDPIEAAKEAKLAQQVRAGLALTVNDAVANFRDVDIDHRHFAYRQGCRTFFDRIQKGLGSIAIRTLEEHPELIVDKLDMRERWKKHREQEQKLLSLLFRAIESVRGRCKITRNPAVIKGCLEYNGLPQRRVKPKGRYRAVPFQDAPRVMAKIQNDATCASGHYPIGERTSCSYLLEFLLRTGVRSKEARLMQYKELREKNKFWLAPIEHLKKARDGSATQRPIKLTPGLQAIIDAVRPRRFDQSGDAYVFPSPVRNKKGECGQPFTQQRIEQLLNRLWPGLDVHGIRTMQRIWGEANKANLDLIDRQQGRRAKGVGQTNYSVEGRPYLEDPTFKQRSAIMEQWERFLDQGRPCRKPRTESK
jgi:integrase